MNDSPAILVERDSMIATVALCNPGKLNVLTAAMWQALTHEMEALSADDELRCVILRGAGDQAFAAGADISEFAQVRNSVDQGKRYHRELVSGALKAIDQCRHPTLAMIHGPCVGGGLEIACQCDLRIAGRSARFGVPISRLGFPIAYDELDAVLPVVGRAAALEILVEGRVWGVDEAYAKGLVTRVVADDALEAETRAAAQRIAEGAPGVARWHKRFVRRLAVKPSPLTAADIEENFEYFNTEDYRIGYAAFLNKKKPRFVGR